MSFSLLLQFSEVVLKSFEKQAQLKGCITAICGVLRHAPEVYKKEQLKNSLRLVKLSFKKNLE
jgi:hypothetical protein